MIRARAEGASVTQAWALLAVLATSCGGPDNGAREAPSDASSDVAPTDGGVDACGSGGGEPGCAACTAGAKKCEGDAIRTCGSDGAYGAKVPCKAPTPYCSPSSVTCVECVSAAACGAPAEPCTTSACNAGRCEAVARPSGSPCTADGEAGTCSAGACALCVDGATRCKPGSKDQPQTCVGARWVDGKVCTGTLPACSLGVCAACAAGDFGGPRDDRSTRPGPFQVVLVDLDGDGRQDMIVVENTTSTTSTNGLEVFRNEGAGSWAAPTFYAQLDPRGCALADLDGDGLVDLVTSSGSSSAGLVEIRLNKGSTTFGAPTKYGAGLIDARRPLVADFDGDGRPDVAVPLLSSGIVLYRNLGAGVLDAPKLVPTLTAVLDAATGDLNGDGKPDFAMIDSGANTLVVLTNDGGGGFGARSSVPLGTYPTGLALGDLTGDGKLDVAITHNAGVLVVANNGAGVLASPVSYPTSAEADRLAIADVNGDGRQDVVVALPTSARVQLLFNLGLGTLGAATEFPVGKTPRQLAVGDVTGDGRPDLMVPAFSADTVGVLRNLCK